MQANYLVRPLRPLALPRRDSRPDGCPLPGGQALTLTPSPPTLPRADVVGVTGYCDTYRGLRSYKTVWAQHLDDSVRRMFYKNWYKSKKAAFRRYKANFDEAKVKADLADIKKHCTVVRVLAHTNVAKAGCHNAKGQKKAHLIEIQVNGGDVAAKVDFAYNMFEKAFSVDTVVAQNEMVDLIGITKGRGTQGVVTRWGVSRLPRKTHRGLRKVGCIGAWHPSAVKWTVPRAGQMGFHHRTELHKKVYRVGKEGEESHKATTEFDMTEKVSAAVVPRRPCPCPHCHSFPQGLATTVRGT